MFFSLLALPAAVEAPDTPVAFEGLYAAYYDPILGYLRQLCGSPEQAEDLAQETFVRAYVGMLGFRGESSLGTWLYRIARNTYLNSQRSGGRHERNATLDQSLPAPSGVGDPVESFAAYERRRQIEQALAALPEQQRSIVLLRDAAALSYGEIAEVLGISVAAVRMKLFRARNTFRAAYDALNAPEGDSHEQL